MVKCQCPKCAKSFEVQSEYLGQNAKCPYCGEIIILQATPIIENISPMPFPQNTNPYQPNASAEQESAISLLSLIFGIFSLFVWLIPLIGLPVSITGMILGACKKYSLGIYLNIIGLAFSIIWAVMGIRVI